MGIPRNRPAIPIGAVGPHEDPAAVTLKASHQVSAP